MEKCTFTAPEELEILSRSRIYNSLKHYYINEYRDHAIRYLCARYAISLGLYDDAKSYLGLRSDELKSNSNYLPHNILKLLIDFDNIELIDEITDQSYNLPLDINFQGDLKHLSDLYQKSLLKVMQNNSDEDQSDNKEIKTFKEIKSLIEKANTAYEDEDLEKARYHSEQILMIKPDLTEILHNLITITSEQGDIEAYERYWRRFVKILLWRFFTNNNAALALIDLIDFYEKVASKTHAKISKTDNECDKFLKRPKFLHQWLEAHTALVWLKSFTNSKPNIMLYDGSRDYRIEWLSFWVKIFYPEFQTKSTLIFDHISFFQTETFINKELENEQKKEQKKDNPLKRIYEYFFKWNTKIEKDISLAMARFINILPKSVFLNVLNLNEISDSYFEEQTKLKEIVLFDRFLFLYNNCLFFEACDYYTSYSLHYLKSARIEMYYADSCAQLGNFDGGFEVACSALKLITKEEADPKTKSEVLFFWSKIFNETISHILEISSSEKKVEQLQSIKEKIINNYPENLLVLKKMEESVHQVETLIENIIIDNTIKKVKSFLNEKKFAEARNVINNVPEYTEELGEFKINILNQVNDESVKFQVLNEIKRIRNKEYKFQHQVVQSVSSFENINNRKSTSEIIKEKKKKEYLESMDDIKQIKIILNSIQETSEGLRIFKSDLLKQIKEEEKQLQEVVEIEEAIEDIQEMVKIGEFSKAKIAVLNLKGNSKEINKLKSNFLKQIKNAEKDAKEAKQIKKTVEKVQDLLEDRRYRDARNAIHSLPSSRQLRDLKNNYLDQIDKAEKNAKFEKTIKTVKKLVSEGNFSDARREIRQLPDYPEDMRRLKSDYLRQIDQVEEQNEISKMINDAVKEAQDCMNKGDVTGAYQTIYNLPDKPKELKEFKDNQLNAIMDAVKRSR